MMKPLVHSFKLLLPMTLAYFALFSFMQILEESGLFGNPQGYRIKKETVTVQYGRGRPVDLPQCPMPPTKADTIEVNKTQVNDLSSLSKRITTEAGGRWRPSTCKSNHKVAILVPYRNRSHMLGTWLQHMHLFLQKQLLDYGIYIIEQDYAEEFNRGALLNIGAQFALKVAPYGCVIFHDIDYLPESLANYYGCPDTPTHFGTKVECKRWKKLWAHHFGGVSAVNVKDFMKVNGFSNGYFGWGSEDDDLAIRMHHEKLNMIQRDRKIGRYRCLSHNQADPGHGRYRLYTRAAIRYKKEGFNSMQYELLKYMEMPLYTWITVHLDKEQIRSNIWKIEKKICETRNCSSGNIWTKHTTTPKNVMS